MSRPLQLTQWQQHLQGRFPQLPTPVVVVLALYSFGMILAKVSGLSAVSLFLAKLLGWCYPALRKRLSEFYKEAAAKSGYRQGIKRQDFDVTTCFAPLLCWILSLWSGRSVALAIDVTNLGDRFHVLCVSVVVRGVAIPVAWKVLLGGFQDPWNPHWQTLLQQLQPAVPADWTVLVLSDRGLESAWLFRVIQEQGWHPLMRAKKGGKFRPTGWGRFYGLEQLVSQVGVSLCVEGRAYSGEQLPCTLLACWNDGYDEPWLVLTDLPPEAGSAVWYAFRAWIEQGFKVIKGGGWDWEKTRMDDPARVERLWLVLAVATLWVVAVGVADEVQQAHQEALRQRERQINESLQQAQARQQQEQLRQAKHKEALQQRQARKQQRAALQRQQREEQRSAKRAKKRARKEQEVLEADGKAKQAPSKKGRVRSVIQREAAAKARAHRVSRRGLAELSALWQKGQNRLPQQLHPEPWPKPCHAASTLTEEEFLAQPK